MRDSSDPVPGWDALLSLCRGPDADLALRECCGRLCASRGWTRAAVLLADPAGGPGEALLTCGGVPADAAAWASGRDLTPLLCFGRVVAFVCGEPEDGADAPAGPEASCLEAALALGVAARAHALPAPAGSDLLHALDGAAAGRPPATVSPLPARPRRFRLAGQPPPGGILLAAGGEGVVEVRPPAPVHRPPTSAPADDALFEALLPLVPGIVLVTEGGGHRLVMANPLARARFPGRFAVGDGLGEGAGPLARGDLALLDEVWRSGVAGECQMLWPRGDGPGAPSLWSVAVRAYGGPDGARRGLVLSATESPGACPDPAAPAWTRGADLGEAVFEGCGIGLMLISLPELRVVRHNAALTPLLGGRAADDGAARGMRVRDLVCAETWDQAGAALREALATGRPVRLEELRVVFAGEPQERFYSVSLAPVTPPGAPGPTHVVAAGVEVTAQARARAALEARVATAEGRAAGLERALQAATDGVALFDGTGALLWRNAAYARFRPAESRHRRRLPVQAPRAASRPASLGFDPVDRALRGETVTGEPYLMHARGGASGSVDASAWPLPGPGGSVSGALLLLRRRGDRGGEARRVAQMVGLATRRADALAAVIGSLSDGVLITDADGSALLVNRAYCDLFGVRGVPRGLRERIAALGARSLDGAPASLEESPVTAALRGRAVVGVRLRVRHSGGNDLVVETSASPILEAGGRVAGCVSVLRDVTRDQRMMEERDDFISVAAHELRTPLTALILETQLIERANTRGELPSRFAPNLHRLSASAERLKKLVDGLMDVGRLERGVVTLTRCLCDLSRLVAEAAERFGTLHPDHPLETECGGVWAEVDPVRLEQMLDNLLDNAAKYCPPGTPISLTLREEDGRAVLAVADRGQGLPEADLPRVFLRYFRGSPHPARRYTGLGLGLFLARQITELHGGQISAANRAGGGLRVEVRLPASVATDGPA